MTNHHFRSALAAFIALLVASTFHLGTIFTQTTDMEWDPVTRDYLSFRTAFHGGQAVSELAIFPLGLERLEAKSLQSVASESDFAMAGDFANYIKGYYEPIKVSRINYSPDQSLLSPSAGRSDFFNKIGDRTHAFWYHEGRTQTVVDINGMVRSGNVADRRELAGGNFSLARLGLRAAGSYENMIDFFLELSNGAQVSGDQSFTRITDPSLERNLKFSTLKDGFFDRYAGYVQIRLKDARLRFGKDAVQWGLSPFGGLIFSSQAAPADGILFDLPYKAVRFTYHHFAVDGTDTNSKGVASKYVAAHRLSISPADWLEFSISDMVVYSKRGVDFAYLNPLAFYVSSGLGSSARSEQDNSLLAVEINARPVAGVLMYGQLVADDINFGTLTDTTRRGNDNKYAIQIGSTVFPSRAIPLRLAIEYNRITPFTFSHRQNDNSWTNANQPLGAQMQPNSDRISGELKWWFTPRTSLSVSWDYTRHGENELDSTGKILMGKGIDGSAAPIGNVGGDILRGDYDFLAPNKFLRGNVSHSRRAIATFSAEWFGNVYTDIKFSYQNTTGGNAPGRNIWGWFELRVGY